MHEKNLNREILEAIAGHISALHSLQEAAVALTHERIDFGDVHLSLDMARKIIAQADKSTVTAMTIAYAEGL